MWFLNLKASNNSINKKIYIPESGNLLYLFILKKNSTIRTLWMFEYSLALTGF